VLVEYDLCPQVTVSDIVLANRSAIAWTYKNIVRYGADPAKLFIAGHSAGGHLNGDGAGERLGERWLAARSYQSAVATSGRVRISKIW